MDGFDWTAINSAVDDLGHGAVKFCKDNEDGTELHIVRIEPDEENEEVWVVLGE